MYRRTALLALFLGLAACASPREACIRDAQAPARDLAREISTAELALARGYRLVTLRDRSFALTTCVGRRSNGETFGYPCQRPVTSTRQEPVAIDYTEERAKLARLRALYARATETAQQRVAYCPPPS